MELIIDKIMSNIGPDSFFTEEDLIQKSGINSDNAYSIIHKGIELDIINEIGINEYAFTEKAINKHNPDSLLNFSKYIENNFELYTNKKISLDVDESMLKDEILMLIMSKKRGDATERLVSQILNNNSIYTTRDDRQNEMWIYREGIYIPQGKSYIMEYCRKILGFAYTTQLFNNVCSKIEADTFIDADDFFSTNYENEICVQNGILNLHTRNLYSFTPTKIFFNKINAKYDPSAKCDNITKFFSEIVKNKEDSKILFEIIGYSLYKNYCIQNAIMFLGEGENGKGITQSLIRHFLGIRNCSSVPLNQLTPDSFSCNELFGKLVNLAGDISNTDLRDSGRFKELTSGTDLIAAKRKFLNDLFFVNYAKLIFSCNELPRVYDFSHGFWRRWVIVEFPYKFVKKTEYDNTKDKTNLKLADTSIINKLISEKEMSGLLNESLNALDHILKTKQFSYTKSTEEVKDLWIRKSDSFTAFCYDMLEENIDAYISKKELRKEFNRYCKKHKVKGTSDKNIKAVLEDLYGVIESRTTKDGEFVRVWEGINFKFKDKLLENKEYDLILNRFKSDKTKIWSVKDFYDILPNSSYIYNNLQKMSSEGLIFEIKPNFYQYL